ncbi:MAG: hypothetical protein M1820_005510 [Bogoriella megaspora]|nr:MAG: hypothetical protein M1820_005510 [Bogoriella megaspora]
MEPTTASKSSRLPDLSQASIDSTEYAEREAPEDLYSYKLNNNIIAEDDNAGHPSNATVFHIKTAKIYTAPQRGVDAELVGYESDDGSDASNDSDVPVVDVPPNEREAANPAKISYLRNIFLLLLASWPWGYFTHSFLSLLYNEVPLQTIILFWLLQGRAVYKVSRDVLRGRPHDWVNSGYLVVEYLSVIANAMLWSVAGLYLGPDLRFHEVVDAVARIGTGPADLAAASGLG